MNEIDNGEIEVRGKRPNFLTVLCILSFVYLGFGLFGGLGGIASGPSSSEEMQQAKVAMAKQVGDMKNQGLDSWVPAMQKVGRMVEQMNENHYLASFINLLITLLGIFAVYLMIRGGKLGFHLYISYCILATIGVYFYVSAANVPSFIVMFNFVFSGLFIFMYSRNLKWMR
ncbi:MAG: hypothetical protein ACJAUD_002430 [Crocinitomicaceae bacterium]|jgi:hypothetical protein